MSAHLFESLASELGDALYPLQRAVEVPGALNEVLARIGVPAQSGSTALTTAISAIVDLKRDIETIAANESPSLDDILRLLQASGSAFDAIRRLDAENGPFSQIAGASGDLVEWLVTQWLATSHPILHEIGVLLTLIQVEADQSYTDPQIVGTEVVRYPYRIERLHLDRVGSLLRDPVGLLRAAYVNALQTTADADAMADALFPKVATLLRSLGVSCRYGVNPGDETLLADSAPYMNHALIVYVTDPLLTGAEIREEAGFVLSLSAADRGDLGLVVRPFGSLATSGSIGPFTVEAKLTAGVDVFALGRHGFTLVANSATEVAGSVTALMGLFGNGVGFMIGSPTGSRLAVGGARLSAEMSLASAGRRVAWSADLLSSTLVIAAGDGDGFLADILPADGVRADFDLGITWASDTGFAFRGSASLDTTLPVSLAIGPVTLSAIHLGLLAQADSGDIVTDLSVNVNAAIGPIRASVERVGLAGRLSFPRSGGNLGAANMALGFKPPSAVGLSIDAHGVLTGGGFLAFDPVQGMYAGVLQLAFQDAITLTAYGLITTKLPDGRPGYSLLIFISADGFQPVPLGFGFVLQRIGGMVGVHRTFDEQALRAGLKTDTLATLLFPRDPVRNATTLLQALATVFPTQRGSYLVGLLARITWFTPTLVTIDLALILELGARTRLLVLARVSALLPTADNDLVRLTLDAVGVADFDASTLALDAALVDSRLVRQFPITGSAALRARWAGNEDFVLAVGGLHPRFAAPAGFPTLERVTIALASGSNPRLVCDAYLAITANTVQFGARASLYAEAVGFSITGDVGFDALITLVPPHFLVGFHAAVQLKRGSHNLFKVAVDGTLEGPLPLRLAAKAKFELLWFSYTVPFDFTLAAGDTTRTTPPAVALGAELAKALADPANWRTQLPAGRVHGVTLAPLVAGGGEGMVLDPLGQLVVKQQVAPLNTARAVTTFGGLPVAGATRFHVVATLNGLGTATPVQGAFAPARYFTMSDDAKLAAPSFEAMDAGLALGEPTAIYDASAIVAASVTYLPITLNPLPTGTPATAPTLATPTTLATTTDRYALPVAALATQRSTGAAARAPVRRIGRARFRHPSASQAATLAAPRWQLVQVSDGAVAPVDPTLTTWSDYRDALDTLNRGGARWQMVPMHELTV